MTWSTTHARLVTMIEGTAPSAESLGLGSRFRHQESDRPPSPRDFRLMVVDGDSWQPGASPCKYARARVVLTVFYDAVTRASDLNVIQVEDYELLAATLGDEDQYNRPTSGIRSVDSTGDSAIYAYEITEDGLEISFTVVYERA